MDKRTIIAVIVSVVVIMVWFRVFPAKPRQEALQTTETKTIKRLENKTADKKENIDEIKTTKIDEGKEIIVKTDKILLALSTQGAGVNKWSIKEKNEWTNLVLKENTKDPLMGYKNVIFDVDRKELTLNEAITEGELNFSYKDIEKELVIYEKYKFSNDSYLVGLNIEIKNESGEEQKIEDFGIGWSAGIGPEDVALKKDRGATKLRPLLLSKENTKEKLNKKLKEGTYQGDIQWIGVDNAYFLMAIVPKEKSFTEAKISQENEVPTISLPLPLILKPGENKEIELQIYVGPKQYKELKNLGFNLEKTIEFGFFGGIGKAVLSILNFFYKITGNFGWSIVLLTMLLQFILLPLTIKSFKSMQGLKKLQPKINELRAKYKEDPKRLNIEMLNLYKTTKTNPFGGCLPIIIQLPIFWALFATLRNAFELRNAPFIFWITDLSSKDPYYVLPILMGIIMFFQQKLTTADPQQAKMVVFMPVIFVVLFLKFPSGLVLYWLVNNALNFTEQLIIIKREK